MKKQHIVAIARKESWHLLRDARSLGLILLMPTMLLFLFGYAIRLDIVEVPLGVLVYDGGADGRDLVAAFDASHAFAVKRHFTDRKEVEDSLNRGEVSAVLVIPYGFARDVTRARGQLQFIVDGVDANSARLSRNYAEALVNDYLERRDVTPMALNISVRTWFNESNESRLAIIPGVIAIVMAVIGALMTSLTIAREMEQGNLVLLRTTALTTGEFLVGKLLPYFAIGMADLFVAVAAAVYGFDVPLRGSLLALTLISAVFLLVVMIQGAIISITAGNQILASQMSLVSTFLPAFLLSGFIFAIDNMPTALQYLSLIVPARYYVALSKVIFLKGVSPLLLWTEVAALLVMLLVMVNVIRIRGRKLGLL